MTSPAGVDRDAGRGDGGARGLASLAPVLAAAVAAAVVLSWPATAHLTDRFAGSYDAPYHAWLGWRIGELWRSGAVASWSIPDAVAPMGLDLRLVDGTVPAWIGALYALVTGNIFVAYNLAVLTGIALNVWSGCALGRVLSTRRIVQVATGVGFAAAPALTGAAEGGHLAFVYAFTLPLLVRHAILIARGDEEVPVARLSLLFVVAFGCSAYHLVFGAVAFVVVVAAWPRSAVLRREALVRIAGAGALALVVLSPFVVARISYERDERAAGAAGAIRVEESEALSADLFGIVTPPDEVLVGLPLPRPPLGEQVYEEVRPAWVGYLLLAGLVGLAASRVPARRALLLATAALWILSLGPTLQVAGRSVGPAWLPERWLTALPGLGALRAPTRASYAIAAVGAASLAVALDRLWAPDRSGRRAVIACVSALLLALSLTIPLRTSDLGIGSTTRAGLEEVARRVGERERDGILVVPWGCRLDDPRMLALQSVHRAANIGCNPPPSATRWYSGIEAWAASSELAALRCDQGHIDRRPLPYDGSERLAPEGVARLRYELGARFVIVDRGLVPAVGCDSVREALAVLAGYEVVSDDGSWTILDLDRPV